MTAALKRNSEIVYYSDDTYLGEGISLGISRGILVKYNDTNIVQEGLGIGAIVLKNRLFTYLPSTCETIQLNRKQFRKTFLVDSSLLWQINGKLSIFISNVIDLISKCYMFLPGFQNKLLKIGTLFRNLLKITPKLIKLNPIAKACFEYSIEKNELHIECEIESLSGYLNKVFILNELGADYFQNGIRYGKIVPAPGGWKSIEENPVFSAFYDPIHNFSFHIDKINIKDLIPYKVYWGREKTKDLCWAGFEFEFDCRNKKIKNFTCSYIAKIKLQKEAF